MMLSVFFYTLYNIVDAYWVSKISAEAIAAVSISQITLFVMISLGFGITAGSGVIMAQSIGAKNTNEAERVLGQSFVLSFLLGVLVTIVALIFRNEFLIWSGASGAIFAPALEYYIILAAGSILMFIMFAIMFGFNSQGDTHTLTKLFAFSTGVNAILDPVMIFGFAGFPALGIGGAAYATLISQVIFIVLGLKLLQAPHRGIRFHVRNLNLRWESVKKVLDIGFPAALTQIIFPVGLALLTYIISQNYFESGAVAFSLGFRIEFFAYLPAVGFGFGAMAMMGQNIGAGNIERARESFRKALKFASIASGALGVLAAVFAGFLIRFFTDDPIVASYAQSYMWTVALSYGFLSALLVEAPAFQAIGRSWPGFWLFFLRVAVIMIPLSFLFARIWHMPIVSVWIAIIAGNVISAVAGYFWIKRALGELGHSRGKMNSKEGSINFL